MNDICVTVPMKSWAGWLEEGDLPGQPAEYESHFMFTGPIPALDPGCRVYVVAHGRVRGYAPLVKVEYRCALNPYRRCLLREGGAEAVTPRCRRHHGRMWVCNAPGCIRGEERYVREDHPMSVTGFRGLIYRWWPPEIEMPYPNWRDDNVPGASVLPMFAAATGGAR